ncbi:hypothetical protein OG943_04670 [Amycolatopsis sp. NBC_00345]|uniref:hypothetical protein n=1 Tax=Amycolatopsis sp. NBC_00345 TaxID=2975955 RepID=UPI002E25905E
MRTGKSLPDREKRAAGTDGTAGSGLAAHRPGTPDSAPRRGRGRGRRVVAAVAGTPLRHHRRPARRGGSTRRIGVPAGLAAVTVVVLAVVLAGCGVRPSGVIPGVPAPSGPVVPQASNSTVLYFLMGSQPTASQREGIRTEPADVLTLLAAGPDDAERAAGLTTEVPATAVPVSVAVEPSGVTVALGIDVSALSTKATQQIACTVRHLDSVAALPPVTLTGGGHSQGPLSCPF